MKTKPPETKNDSGEDREVIEQPSITTTFSRPANEAMNRNWKGTK